MLAKVVGELQTVEHFIVIGDGDARAAVGGAERRDPALRRAARGRLAEYDWPEIDERQAAAMCYTSRHDRQSEGRRLLAPLDVPALARRDDPGRASNLSERERILTIVPMFHANAWGIPYAAFMCGASLVMPGRFLQAEPLTRMIKEERVTFSGAVPTIWADILRYGEEHEIDLSSIRMIICGGSAVPRSLMERFEERYGVRIVQAWGMTETSPLAAVAHPPASVELGCAEEMDWRAETGRVVSRCRAAHRRRRRQPAALGRRGRRRDRGARAVDHRRLLRRPVAREVRRRLVAHRRRRHASTRTASCRSPTGPRT